MGKIMVGILWTVMMPNTKSVKCPTHDGDLPYIGTCRRTQTPSIDVFETNNSRSCLGWLKLVKMKSYMINARVFTLDKSSEQ